MTPVGLGSRFHAEFHEIGCGLGWPWRLDASGARGSPASRTRTSSVRTSIRCATDLFPVLIFVI